MFNQQQMQGQLPYAVNQLQFPIGNYNFVPNIGLEPHLQQFAQLVQPMAQVLIEEIQKNSRMSPLRTFLFNQMAVQGFQNPDFAGLVKGAIEYFGYLVRRNQVQSPQQGVYKAAQEMVMFVTANNVRRFPALQQFEDPNKIQFVLNNFDAVSSDMQRERMQGTYPGTVQQFGMGGGNQFQNFQQGANFQQAAGGPTNNRNFGGSGSSGIFTTNEPSRMDNVESNSGMGRSYGASQSDNSAAAASETLVQEEILTHVEQNDFTVSLEEANKNWRPSDGSCYRPAFEPSHQKLVATKQGGRYFYQVKELGENEMDPSKHRLTPLFGNSNSLLVEKLKGSVEETSKVLSEAVSDAKAATNSTPVADITLDTYSRIRLESMPVELGYDSVWVSGIIERMKRAREREGAAPIHILQWDAKVVKAVVIESAEEVDLVRRFSRMDSSQLLMAIGNKKDRLSPATLKIIDDRLTEATNTAIKTCMSISGLNIDSFIDDWNDLVNHISNSYGEMIAAKFMAKDEEIIRNALNLMDYETSQDVTSGIYDTADGETYPISYFSENVSFTMLDFFSSELDLDFVKGTSALLSKVNTRVWFDLADQIFREYGDKCARHLIRTTDGKVLEVKKGWLADNAYIVNIVG